jgi:hypothetical protein
MPEDFLYYWNGKGVFKSDISLDLAISLMAITLEREPKMLLPVTV